MAVAVFSIGNSMGRYLGLPHERPHVTHLEANSWSGGPGDHDGRIRHLGVVRWNGARRLHCKVTNMKFKTVGS